MPRLRRLLAAVTLLALVACGSSVATLGPLTLEPPKGWFIADRERDTIKIANGTIADGTASKPGTATAVFDVYTSSDQTVKSFKKVLEENNTKPNESQIKVDGYNATVVAYESGFFGPATEVVFIPEWRVRIVYRAAFGDDDASFNRFHDDFRDAIGSIRFAGRPPDRA